jgi:hypothetical protein
MRIGTVSSSALGSGPWGADHHLSRTGAPAYGLLAIPIPLIHRPTLVYFNGRHSLPAEVCATCSDEPTGVWVPVTQCPVAAALMRPGDASLYADVWHLDRPGPTTD